jgi:hypothetical protein
MEVTQFDVLLIVIAVLDRLEIAYAVGGSYASSAHGIARATRDIDIIADIRPEQATPLVEALQADFYADEQAISRAIKMRQSFNVIHEASMVKVDLFVLKPGSFQVKQFERRLFDVISPESQQKVYVMTPEDTILAKLDWYRKGNYVSTQQWNDINGVIKVQGSGLDLEYLKTWARELGVEELLERAIEESLDGKE